MSEHSAVVPNDNGDTQSLEVGPDNAETVLGSLIDNSIPTMGYHSLPVVGVGGSAGSIGELQKFFGAMPPNSGMAFVVILHLSPEHESMLAEVIQQQTSMPVIQVTKNTALNVDSVYVIPPGKHLTMMNGHLSVSDMSHVRGKRVAVDLLFRTLADTHGPHSTAIVLSGADSDGAIGIKRIKERGGLTIVQDPTEADFDSMPRAAIATGMVDWVLPVRQMPSRVLAYRQAEGKIIVPPEDGPTLAKADFSNLEVSEDEALLREVLIFLRMRTGREFMYYKRATVVRRVKRRIQVNGLTGLADYLAFLRTHPGEAVALLKDLLISVTNFFRDREAFESLESITPELFEGKNYGDAVRVWVAACATGEEAYSIAILLCEQSAKLSSPPPIQIFATDLDVDAIAVAREGLYPDTITADVSEERLRQFFVKEHGGYRIKSFVRELVLFAVHDLLKDSPFSRLDLVSSRNLLIYLNREAQSDVFNIFHFALRPQGKLFLGISESVDESSTLFAPMDKKYRLYSRRDVPSKPLLLQRGKSSLAMALAAQNKLAVHASYLQGRVDNSPEGVLAHPMESAKSISSWADLHFNLMEKFSPPSVVVNSDYDIVHLSGHASRFLHFIGGETTVNLLRVVPSSLRVELRGALFRAAQIGESIEVKGLHLEHGDQEERVDIIVTPAHGQHPDFLLVVFNSRTASQHEPHRLESAEPVMHQLEQELMQVKGELRATVEQYATTIEELKAANEELQAMNEELRSATEEMETGREELQSINEELTTVNQEAKGKMEELAQSNSDLQNLMASTAIATIFLDHELCVKRYTPTAVDLFNLIPTDLGRPLSDLSHLLFYPEMKNDTHQVLNGLELVEREVRHVDKRWFMGRVLPYKADDEKVAGVVLTFLNITQRKKAEDQLRQREIELVKALEDTQKAKEAAESMAEDKDHFLGILSHELRIPLAPVVMILPSLLEHPNLDEDTRAGLTMIARNIEIEAHLIEQMMDFTSITRGKINFNEVRFDVHEVVKQALEVTSPDMKSKCQTLQVFLRAEDTRILGHATSLRQAFWNLLKNAGKFTPEGGSIQVCSYNSGGKIIVEVIDSGIGIAAKNIEDIFKAFEQGDMNIRREFGGLGLGLSIARAAIQGHGGRIHATSAGENHGASFVVELPMFGEK